MRTRQLGNSDIELTTIGLGTWAIGGAGYAFGWGSQDDTDSIQTIHTALDLGINWIDTAPVYGLGHSETIVGKAIRGVGERPYISTKCGLVWPAGGKKVSHDLSAAGVKRECEASLKRLGIEVIDIYNIHWPIPDERIEEAWAAIADLIHEGKVRFGGVSNFSVDQSRRVGAIHPVTSEQPPYSMLVRGIEHDLLPYCREKNIGVVGYSPMQNGLLTGKMTPERIEALPKDDWRRRNEHFQEPQLTANLVLVRELSKIAEELGQSPARLAIAWAVAREGVTSAIVGARRPEQIEENAAAADLILGESTQERIAELLRNRAESIERSVANNDR